MPPLYLVCLLGLIPLLVILFPIYRREKQANLNRLRAGSQVIQTPTGTLEYAMSGEGYPVVVLHGMGGGYDQGLLVGSLLDANHYHIIAPTRPGYRRTLLETGTTFEEQADAIAYLLDTLNIPKAAVVALSGGGLAAIPFAIRHPERCRGLVLLSAHGPATLNFLPNRKLLWVFEGMVLADFLLWLVPKLPMKPIMRLEGYRKQRLEDPQTMGMVRVFMSSAFPAADWKDGTRNDIEQLFALEGKPDWTLEQIKAPTLVLHGKNDFIVRMASAQMHTERIPNAKLIVYGDGTHFAFITHHAEIKQEIEAFLRQL